MPRLLLLRHAKAENAGKGGGGDHERALSKRGRTDAAEIGRVIAGRGEPVGVVLCSTAIRARETWELVQAALPVSAEERFLRDIYTAEESYLPILRSEAGEAGSVMLIGHNPTIQNTALKLTTQGGGGATRLPPAFPTAALAIFEFDAAWAEVASARLIEFVTPRNDPDA